ncbi:hypothetical protein [Micromonospora sp. DH14]|uniref:hypothetical protein n=1 Tax=Micromonospora sp. DH14 TaxID=3040120 RepID=UPI002441112A|nr:hypothetical protein [Micromonospora sp. DH14]MDG9675554.1 hypothetical protein [Micromonospora sp. DH14]
MPTHKRTLSAQQRSSDMGVLLLVIAAFGPYVVSGVRTEQLAVFAIAGIALLARARQLSATPLAALLAGYVSFAAVAAIGPAEQLSGHGAVGFWAGLDNLALPLAALTAGSLIAAGQVDRARLIRIVAGALLILLAANSVASYVSLMNPGQYDHVLSMWWSGASEITTAERAATMGRYSGIFNQPAEAGVMYSIGIVAAAYLLRRRLILFATAGVTLTLGGLLTASKVFLLVGLPIALWQTWAGSTWRTRTGTVIAVAGVLAAFDYQTRQSGSPIGGVLLGTWLHPGERSQSLLSLYTAGRFGEQSVLADIASIVLKYSPFAGFGLDGMRVPYDSTWVEALVMAGVIGLVLQALIIAVLVWSWLRVRRWADPAAVRFGAGLVAIVVAGSTGLTVTTGNRIATVVWLLVALLLVAPPARSLRVAAPPPAEAPIPTRVVRNPRPGSLTLRVEDRRSVGEIPWPVPTRPLAVHKR